MFNFLRNFSRKTKKTLSEKYFTDVLDAHSQYAEDLILDRFMMHQDKGFYIDIGANDPNKFSNTLRFYKRGWHGINVEPNVLKFNAICASRQRDINLNVGIGPTNDAIPFYLIDPDTLSTFSKEVADKAVSEGFKLDKVTDVPVIRLDALLEEHCKGQQIDFMSLDVEGFELGVLESNNWALYRPRFILIEINRSGEQIDEWMRKVGYVDIFDNKTNKIYADAPAIRALSSVAPAQ